MGQLGRDPGYTAVDTLMLANVATALKTQALQLYQDLATRMDQRGDPASAQAFRDLLQMGQQAWEATHPAQGSTAGSSPSTDQPSRPQPPAEFAQAWEDIANSTLLTPFRIFATAVWNQQRASSLFSYMAAQAADDGVRVDAERLAVRALDHAAALRKWRRQAWHLERAEAPDSPEPEHPTGTPPQNLADLEAFLTHSWADVGRRFQAVAARLHELQADAAAGLLEQLLCELASDGRLETQASVQVSPALQQAIASQDEALPLLVLAQRPLEQLAEQLEAVLDQTSEGDLMNAAASEIDTVISLLRRLSQQTS